MNFRSRIVGPDGIQTVLTGVCRPCDLDRDLSPLAVLLLCLWYFVRATLLPRLNTVVGRLRLRTSLCISVQ